MPDLYFKILKLFESDTIFMNNTHSFCINALKNTSPSLENKKKREVIPDENI